MVAKRRGGGARRSGLGFPGAREPRGAPKLGSCRPEQGLSASAQRGRQTHRDPSPAQPVQTGPAGQRPSSAPVAPRHGAPRPGCAKSRSLRGSRGNRSAPPPASSPGRPAGSEGQSWGPGHGAPATAPLTHLPCRPAPQAAAGAPTYLARARGCAAARPPPPPPQVFVSPRRAARRPGSWMAADAPRTRREHAGPPLPRAPHRPPPHPPPPPPPPGTWLGKRRRATSARAAGRKEDKDASCPAPPPRALAGTGGGAGAREGAPGAGSCGADRGDPGRSPGSGSSYAPSVRAWGARRSPGAPQTCQIGSPGSGPPAAQSGRWRLRGARTRPAPPCCPLAVRERLRAARRGPGDRALLGAGRAVGVQREALGDCSSGKKAHRRGLVPPPIRWARAAFQVSAHRPSPPFLAPPRCLCLACRPPARPPPGLSFRPEGGGPEPRPLPETHTHPRSGRPTPQRSNPPGSPSVVLQTLVSPRTPRPFIQPQDPRGHLRFCLETCRGCPAPRRPGPLPPVSLSLLGWAGVGEGTLKQNRRPRRKGRSEWGDPQERG